MWFGTLLKERSSVSIGYIRAGGRAFVGGRSAASVAVLLVLASVLFWSVMPPGSAHYPHFLRRLAVVLQRVYLVHHVLLTLVFLPFVQGHRIPLAGMFPVYLAAGFIAGTAVLTAMKAVH